jgi:hypothetical protein
MNWDAIGAVGEIIGAMAVFLTLIYLALQIRQNTKAVQAAAVDASVGKLNDVRGTMYGSSEISHIYIQGLAHPDELDEESRLRFRLLIHNILLAISNVHSQTGFAGLSISTWESQIVIVKRIMTTPGGQRFWKEHRLEFEETFRDQVDRILKENSYG